MPLCDIQQHSAEVFFIAIAKIPLNRLIIFRRKTGSGQQFRHLIRQRGFKIDGHAGGQTRPEQMEVRDILCSAMEVDHGEITGFGIGHHLL
jgi:hypothetical protein